MDTPTGIGEVNIVHVERWPSEIPLLVLAILASLGIWVLRTSTIIRIVDAAMIAAMAAKPKARMEATPQCASG